MTKWGEKDKRTNNDQQNVTLQTKYRATRTILNHMVNFAWLTNIPDDVTHSTLVTTNVIWIIYTYYLIFQKQIQACTKLMINKQPENYLCILMWKILIYRPSFRLWQYYRCTKTWCFFYPLYMVQFITGFLRRVTQPVPHVEQELLSLPKHMSSPRLLVGFVLLNL